MLDLEEFRERVIALNESDAKSILMLTYTWLDMVKGGNGSFTSDECVEKLLELYNKIPNLVKKNND